MYIPGTYFINTPTNNELSQHAHIENIKTVANLTNNKDVFMCNFMTIPGTYSVYTSTD